MAGSLILTVTRACNLRCAYCPTVKDGWPSLTPEDARQAVRIFAELYGGGDIKLFGGEPMLQPTVVEAAFEAAEREPAVRRISISTNGVLLSREWLARFSDRRKGLLTVSLDGRPRDHQRLRRSNPGVADSHERILELLGDILKVPRVVVTQTIAPATAADAVDNFRYLLELGFRRLKLLPGYYIPWRSEQLVELSAALDGIGREIVRWWAEGRYLNLVNLGVRAPTPFFNTGMVVDADRTIHVSNVGLAGSLEKLREQTVVGTLDDPPSPEALRAGGERINGLLARSLPSRVWSSTLAVDAELSRLCRSLYAPLATWRTLRRRAA